MQRHRGVEENGTVGNQGCLGDEAAESPAEGGYKHKESGWDSRVSPVSGFSSLTPTLWLLGFTAGFSLFIVLAESSLGSLVLWLVTNMTLMRTLSLQIMPLFSRWGLARPRCSNLATSAKGMLTEKCGC